MLQPDTWRMSVTMFEWEWGWARSGFFFCPLMIANHCPLNHKQKQENCENERPTPALKKPVFQKSPYNRVDQHGWDGKLLHRNRSSVKYILTVPPLQASSPLTHGLLCWLCQ